MSKKHVMSLMSISLLALLVLFGCGNTNDTDTASSETTPEVESTVNEDSPVAQEDSGDSSEDSKGKIEIGEEMELVEADEIEDYVADGSVVRLYVTFKSSENGSSLEDDLAELETLLSSDSNFEIRRKDVSGNAAVIALTDTSIELLKKDSSIAEISIMEEADTNSGTVSK